MVVGEDVDTLGVALAERDPDSPAGFSVGQFIDQLPVLAAIGCLVDSAARSSFDKVPGPSIPVPSGRVNDVRISGIHRQVDNARMIVQLEHLIPGLATIGRLVDSSFRVLAVEVAEHADVDRVLVSRVDQDFADMLAFRQPHVLPSLPFVRRLENPGSRIARALTVVLPGSDPDGFAVLAEREIADSAARIAVEYRLE